MFEEEQKFVAESILEYCKGKDYPILDVKWAWIPFNGQWGISTSFFQLAAATFGKSKGNVAQRANEIANDLAEKIRGYAGFDRVEAVNGYLNLYFSTAEYASRVIQQVFTDGSHYGHGERLNQRLMVEFSHPNTHKAFHVWAPAQRLSGDVLARILEAAGYEVIRAIYPGDIGLHVIKWLWNYLKYHKGEKPDRDITRWMGSLYAEAVKRLDQDPRWKKKSGKCMPAGTGGTPKLSNAGKKRVSGHSMVLTRCISCSISVSTDIISTPCLKLRAKKLWRSCWRRGSRRMNGRAVERSL
jgi:arginyl-tRNA synthetase